MRVRRSRWTMTVVCRRCAVRRLLKNAGYLPPELEMRRDALALSDLLRELDPDDNEARELAKRLTLLEMKLQQAGMSTDFLRGEYRPAIGQRLQQEK